MKARDEKAATRLMEEFDSVFAKCRLQGKKLERRYGLLTLVAGAGLFEAQRDYRALAAEHALSEEPLQRPGAAAEYHLDAMNFTTRTASSGDSSLIPFRGPF